MDIQDTQEAFRLLDLSSGDKDFDRNKDLSIINLEWLMFCEQMKLSERPMGTKRKPKPRFLRDSKESRIHKRDPSMQGKKVLAPGEPQKC